MIWQNNPAPMLDAAIPAELGNVLRGGENFRCVGLLINWGGYSYRMATSQHSKGALGEAIAMTRMMRLGYTVLHPQTTESYDFLAVKDGRHIRVQVKAASKTNTHRGNQRYSFNVCRGRARKMYEDDSIDYFVFVALDSEKCWVADARTVKSKFFHVGENNNGKYREAWHLMD